MTSSAKSSTTTAPAWCVNLSATPELENCIAAYKKELAVRTSSGSLIKSITPEQRESNEKVFEILVQYQKELDVYRSLCKENRKPQVLPAMYHPTNPRSYPENLQLDHYLHLQQILPIPDIHQISDCDTIYRFLIARHFRTSSSNEVHLVVADLLNYLLFREKYALNSILYDPFLTASFNGRDAQELLEEALLALEKADPKGAIQKPKSAKEATSSHPYVKMVQEVRNKLSRRLLYEAWRTWNIGLDRTGHVILYQKPKAELLRALNKRWPYLDKSYDWKSGGPSSTHDESNLIVRLYLRGVEKGRRISRMLHHQNQKILRENGKWMAPGWDGLKSNSPPADAGNTTCLVDVADISLGTFTASKYEEVMKVFKIVSLMGQSYFPENMHQMLIVNGGFVFRMLFKLVKPWLDPQTQKKIVVLSSTNKYTVDELLEDSDNIHLATPIRPLPPSSPTGFHASLGTPTSATSAVSINSFPSQTGQSLALETSSEKIKKDRKHFELYTTLLEYIPSNAIPSWYGGQLVVQSSPYHYAHLLHPSKDLAPLLERLQKDLSELKSAKSSPLPVSFAAQNVAFLQTNQEEKYWKGMERVQSSPRFQAALDVVQTLAPPELLPDELLLPMLYYNAEKSSLGQGRREPSITTAHADPNSGVSSLSHDSMAVGAGQTGIVVGPVTDVECDIFGQFLNEQHMKVASIASPITGETS